MFDTIDIQLLQLLQANAKYTNKELALKLGLSVTAVFERIKKLERQDVIDKYVAIVNREKLNKGFMAFCHVTLEKHIKSYVIAFEKEVGKIPEVLECYHISGDYDYILKIVVKDMEAFRSFLVDKITSLPHIGSTHTMFMINEVKQDTAIPYSD
ncbi:MAG: Lrp/AsnC family transcriptional regulator [Flavobacteriaceae bacterium]|nr:Lrp/AsnC family transcriptional regulator [Flavobacteriaceae bacterium]